MKINKKLIVPAIIAVMTYLLCYQIPKILVDPADLHFLCLPIDNMIPFFGPFIYIYIGAFFQWAYCIHTVLQQETQLGYKFCSAIVIGSLIGFVIFMVYPTAVNRPEIIGDGFTNNFCRFIYSVDNIVCACPSFHCFCSTIVILIYNKCENVSKKMLYFNVVFSILVFISTLFIKQHFVMDLLPGILLAYISMFLASKINIFKNNK